MDIRILGSIEAGEGVIREGTRDLSRAIASEVEEDDRVTIVDRRERLTRGINKGAGLYEFVRKTVGISCFDGFGR